MFGLVCCSGDLQQAEKGKAVWHSCTECKRCAVQLPQPHVPPRVSACNAWKTVSPPPAAAAPPDTLAHRLSLLPSLPLLLASDALPSPAPSSPELNAAA